MPKPSDDFEKVLNKTLAAVIFSPSDRHMAKSPITYRSRQDIEEVASGLLREHDMWYLPVDPIRLATKYGIRLYNATFDDESISGVLARRGPNITLLVNATDSAYRKRFTIAHELGHYFLEHYVDEQDHTDRRLDLYRGPPPKGNDVKFKPEEVQANAFAAGLLMPSGLVVEALELSRDPDVLAKMFQVSTDAMGIRLNQLDLI